MWKMPSRSLLSRPVDEESLFASTYRIGAFVGPGSLRDCDGRWSYKSLCVAAGILSAAASRGLAFFESVAAVRATRFGARRTRHVRNPAAPLSFIPCAIRAPGRSTIGSRHG